MIERLLKLEKPKIVVIFLCFFTFFFNIYNLSVTARGFIGFNNNSENWTTIREVIVVNKKINQSGHFFYWWTIFLIVMKTAPDFYIHLRLFVSMMLLKISILNLRLVFILSLEKKLNFLSRLIFNWKNLYWTCFNFALIITSGMLRNLYALNMYIFLI